MFTKFIAKCFHEIVPTFSSQQPNNGGELSWDEKHIKYLRSKHKTKLRAKEARQKKILLYLKICFDRKMVTQNQKRIS